MTAKLNDIFESVDTDATGAEDITWGELAALSDDLLTSYARLAPSRELREYHGANLRLVKAFHENALARPSEESFIADFTVLLLQLIAELFEVGFDESKTEEEKDLLMEQLSNEKLAEFFGPEFLAASQAVDGALESLSAETRSLVAASSCYSSLLDEEQGTDATPTLEPTSTPTPSPTAVPTPTVAVDRAALIALFNSTGGRNWAVNTNWLSDESIGEWHGVYTDDNGRVIGLNLYDNRLSGEITPELGSLSNLRALQLAKNDLTGRIPASLGRLTNLWQLSLGGNRLEGIIPSELASLRNLGILTLEQNNLTGSIPTWLGGLPHLQELALGSNQMKGDIPRELAHLSGLTTLTLEGNRLTGTVPTWVRGFTNLEVLLLGNNQLTGKMPAALGDLSNLEWLDLGFNNLTGPIPDGLGELTNLKLLGIASNRLTGPIPDGLGQLTNLQSLFLQANELSGCVPAGLRDQLNMESSNLGDLPFC